MLKYIINELGSKVRIVAEEVTMKRSIGDEIYHTILYVKEYYGKFIKLVLKRHELSETRDKESKFIEPIHTESVN